MAESNEAEDLDHLKIVDPADIFDDLSKLRVSQDFASQTNAQKLLLKVPVRKPGKEWWVRTHPDESYSEDCYLLELKDSVESFGSETYVVVPEVAHALDGESTIRPTKLVLSINRQGVLFLWPIKLPLFGGKLDDWNQTALDVATGRAKTSWVRVQANRTLGSYRGTRISPPPAATAGEQLESPIRGVPGETRFWRAMACRSQFRHVADLRWKEQRGATADSLLATGAAYHRCLFPPTPRFFVFSEPVAIPEAIPLGAAAARIHVRPLARGPARTLQLAEPPDSWVGARSGSGGGRPPGDPGRRSAQFQRHRAQLAGTGGSQPGDVDVATGEPAATARVCGSADLAAGDATRRTAR